MKRLPARKSTVIAIVSLLVGGVFAIASCSQQGEGEVCNFSNGNDDCNTDNGLACYEARTLNNTTSDRCCPLDRSKATHPTCVVPIAAGAIDGSAPADTGPPPTVDAGGGGATDAAADADADQ